MNVDDAFGNWLAGFIDGEGSFAIQRWEKPTHRDPYYCCRFSLRVRADERPIVEEIIARTGIGVLTERPSDSRGRANPTIVWQAQAKADVAALVELLDRFPLRAKKLHDYLIWREAVIAWGETRRAVKHDWTRIAELKEMLEAGRKFDPAAAKVPA